MRYPTFKSAILLFFIVVSASAQENLLYKKVQEKKTAGMSFKTIPSIFSQEKEDRNSLDQFINPDEVYFLQYNPSEMNTLSDAITLMLPLKNKELKLELFEVPASFYNYEVVTDNGQRYPANRKIKHYRGIVKDDPHSIVAITFLEDEILGLVATDKGNFNLSFDKQLKKHLFYNDKNLKKKPDFECGTTDSHPAVYNPEILLNRSKEEILSSKSVYFYFETEYDIFETRGSVWSVEGFVTGLYNQVATLYENENIGTGISEIHVWTTSDPFTSNTPEGLLAQFQNQRTNFDGNLGQLLTFRSLGGGIAAGFNGICNSNIAQRLSVTMLYNTYSTVPNYSWSVFSVTHELGHLFGSRHTHACVWNGNNTAIDGCGPCQESPDPEDETCDNCTRPAIPPGGGTIMSYCHLESVGINFNLGFGLQPGNVIRNSVENGNCLCECTNAIISGPNVVCSSGAWFTVEDPPEGATISWSCDPDLTRISDQGSNPCLFQANSDGSAWIEVTVTCNDLNYDLATKSVWSGHPVTPAEIYGDYGEFCPSSYYWFLVDDPYNMNATFDWDVTGDAYLTYGQGSSPVEVYTTQPGSFYLTVAAYNTCGYSDDLYSNTYYISGYCKSGMFVLYPNPADDNIKVELTEDPSESAVLEVYNSQLIKVISTSIASKEKTINISKLPKGIYYVTVLSKGKVNTEKFIKK